MNKSLVIIPTYNERKSLPRIISSVLGYGDFDVLVVDDASPDGTAELVREIMAADNRVSIIQRGGKSGLGTAYIAGFKWGLDRGYSYFFEMDGDGSHNPDALPWFITEIERGCDLLIGSRYIGGKISVVGWGFKRLLLSKIGNFYASKILGISLTDLTSGFRCYRYEALKAIDLDQIRSNGYSFQIEMAHLVAMAGYKVGEMPITFYERNSGSSKMTGKIVREAIILPWKLRIKKVRDDLAKSFLNRKNVKEISA